jgi:hypothetical protein
MTASAANEYSQPGRSIPDHAAKLVAFDHRSERPAGTRRMVECPSTDG